MTRQQGFDGYYNSLAPDAMSGLAFIGDASLDAAVAAAAAAAGADVAADAAPPPGSGNEPSFIDSIGEGLTVKNVAIGGGLLVGAYLLYRHFKKR